MEIFYMPQVNRLVDFMIRELNHDMKCEDFVGYTHNNINGAMERIFKNVLLTLKLPKSEYPAGMIMYTINGMMLRVAVTKTDWYVTLSLYDIRNIIRSKSNKLVTDIINEVVVKLPHDYFIDFLEENKIEKFRNYIDNKSFPFINNRDNILFVDNINTLDKFIYGVSELDKDELADILPLTIRFKSNEVYKDIVGHDIESISYKVGQDSVITSTKTLSEWSEMFNKYIDYDIGNPDKIISNVIYYMRYYRSIMDCLDNPIDKACDILFNKGEK